MPNTKIAHSSNFQAALDDPSGGLDSSAYQSLAPMLSRGLPKDPAAAARAKHLHEGIRRGAVAMDYLTGARHNEGNTFYDEHPTQAVATDAFGHAGAAGLATAVGGIGTNLYREGNNHSKYRKIQMAAEGDKKNHGTRAEKVLYGDGNKHSTQDLESLFGSEHGAEGRKIRTTVLDRLNNNELVDVPDPQDPTKTTRRGRFSLGLDAEEAAINGLKDEEKAKRLADFMEKTRVGGGQAGAGKLNKHYDFHKALTDAKTNGGLKAQIGEGLNKHRGTGGVLGRIADYLAPHDLAHLHDVAHFSNLGGADVDPELLKSILAHHGHTGASAERFVDALRNRNLPLGGKKIPLNNFTRFLSSSKLPIAAGGALAAGGLGAYGLMKAFQNMRYSPEQQKDWQRIQMKAKGDFAGADRLV